MYRPGWLMLLSLVACAPGPARRAVLPPAGDDEASVEVGDEGDDDGGALDEVPAWEPGRPLVDEVTRELAAMHSSTYSHRTHVSEAAGRFELDCSGLVDYALARAAPRALAELRAATVRRPLAKHYVAFLRALGAGATPARWRAISHAADLEPGDVIAWLRPADVSTRNTGHVMIVGGQVDRYHHGVLIVPVIDSTSVPHGASDSRSRAHATGMGTGEVVLLLDDAGAPIGYRWSRGRKARPHATTIAMGRIE